MGSLAKGCQTVSGQRQGRRIAIQTDQAAVGLGSSQDASRVASCAKGSVDIVTPRPRFEGGEHLLVKYRGVRSGVGVLVRRAHGLPRGKVEVCEAPGVRIRVGHPILFPGPDPGTPDFEILSSTNKDGIAFNPRVLAQELWKKDAAH